MKRFIGLAFIFLVSLSAQSEEFVIESVKIMDKEPHYANSRHSRITVLIPKNINRGYSVECTYYKMIKDSDPEIVASTNHLALKVTPEWTVKAKPEDIDFVICKGIEL
ncbi:MULTISPECIES: hypothetical protein [unclassified Shewanella]|uniref:hypothetical protein n=1 Tax=unclassified Shewanella TaxID=196818 RepID=UPI000C84D154|nr:MULTISPECIES: hypothetical protein [unclassified Shewanella]MDO6679392.1 hypothetical protein [Shewanella sp. 4_MG-2023]PMG51487.1 hypothetical protein BCU91_16505 [Shewanella sp. 10N.286.52.B9]